MKYKTLFISLPILLFNFSLAHCQVESGAAKNNTYLEVGTNVIISSISINYEMHLYSSDTEKFHLYGRTGLGASVMFWGHDGWGGIGGLTMLTGKNAHHFETSAGALLGYERHVRYSGEIVEELFVFPLLYIGYRYQKPGKGFLFRAKAGILGIGIGLGYAF